jgi:ribosomal protein S18 acetylase RimI-like enzyme
MIKNENDLLTLQMHHEKKSEETQTVFSQLTETSLSAISQIHNLFPQWKRVSVIKKLKDTHDGKDFRFIATINGAIIAHVKYVKQQGIHSHVMHVTSLIVSKQHRRKGIALGLMKYSLEKLPKEVKIITLAVDSKNKPAINLYKKLGFEKYGILKKASFINGKYVDNYMMQKSV